MTRAKQPFEITLFELGGERDAEEELMLLRVLEEGSMGIICIFILLPENGGSPAFIPVQCSFKKGKSLHQTSCIISKPFHPACECSESLEASNETCPVLPPHARARHATSVLCASVFARGTII